MFSVIITDIYIAHNLRRKTGKWAAVWSKT